jgi:hypothetical protein
MNIHRKKSCMVRISRTNLPGEEGTQAAEDVSQRNPNLPKSDAGDFVRFHPMFEDRRRATRFRAKICGAADGVRGRTARHSLDYHPDICAISIRRVAQAGGHRWQRRQAGLSCHPNRIFVAIRPSGHPTYVALGCGSGNLARGTIEDGLESFPAITGYPRYFSGLRVRCSRIHAGA